MRTLKMARNSQLVIFILLTTFATRTTQLSNYFWRTYNGEIPYDALSINSDGVIIYIGQGLAKDNQYFGNIPGTIYSNSTEFQVAMAKPENVDYDIKVLCGSPYSFEWISTDASRFFMDMINYKPILGGWQISIDQSERSPLYIGRVSKGNEYGFGKIVTNTTNSLAQHIQLVYKDKIYDFDKFEVLVYNSF